MVYDLILAGSGFLIGIILAILTKEEFKSSKKYLAAIKNLLLGILGLISIWSFILSFSQQWFIYYLLILILALLFTLLIQLLIKKPWAIIVPYGVVILSYFLLLEPPFRLILTAVAFLYGLPAGTIFYHGLQKRS